MKKKLLILSILVLSLTVTGCNIKSNKVGQAEKLHWFIPDGMRSDPEVFNIFEWAKEGKLPNIKKLMENGSYGYSIPTFPTHTPTNFATLLTGTYPKTHGVADGPMHIEGQPLAKPSVSGFSSTARKKPAIWSILEDAGKKVVLLSVPGSTPPELKHDSITIRGRWGGWGADFHSLIFEKKTPGQREKLARSSRLFFLGYELTRFIGPITSSEWNYELAGHGTKIYAKIVDDKVHFSFNKETTNAQLAQGEWSDWLDVTLKWKEQDVSSHIKLNVIKLEGDFFRIRMTVNNLNKYITDPGSVAEELIDKIGPMVDFVDNFPPQLIYYQEDKNTFLDEAHMSLDWHKDAVGAIYDLYSPDVFIHNIYTPNQVLTSRWWLGYIDPSSKRYEDVSQEKRDQLWSEVKDIYQKLDAIVGQAIKNTDKDTLLVLSSDHGATPLDKWVRLNNLFVKKGWLKYSINAQTGEPVIDWDKTKVLYLKMDSIYIDPAGLGEVWNRASGPAYEKLRDEVIEALENLQDEDSKPVVGVVKWEDVEEFLDLPKDRVGDLVVANLPGYGWNEEITTDGKIFDIPLKTGYKQAIYAKETKAMWTPFIIMGPGVKKNYQIKEPIEMVDQFPTIMTLMGQEIPDYIEGNILNEIFK